jgi:hypothetical protein
VSTFVRLVDGFGQHFGKRLIKTPKLFFLDKGLALAWLGIGEADALSIHAQRGALFETQWERSWRSSASMWGDRPNRISGATTRATK